MLVLPKRDGRAIEAVVIKNANGDMVKYKPVVQAQWEYWTGGFTLLSRLWL